MLFWEGGPESGGDRDRAPCRASQVRDLHKAAQPGHPLLNREIPHLAFLFLLEPYVTLREATLLQGGLDWAASPGYPPEHPRGVCELCGLIQDVPKAAQPGYASLAAIRESIHVPGEPHPLRGEPRDDPAPALGRTAGIRETMGETQLPGVVDLLGDVDMQAPGAAAGTGPSRNQNAPPPPPPDTRESLEAQGSPCKRRGVGQESAVTVDMLKDMFADQTRTLLQHQAQELRTGQEELRKELQVGQETFRQDFQKDILKEIKAHHSDLRQELRRDLQTEIQTRQAKLETELTREIRDLGGSKSRRFSRASRRLSGESATWRGPKGAWRADCKPSNPVGVTRGPLQQCRRRVAPEGADRPSS